MKLWILVLGLILIGVSVSHSGCEKTQEPPAVSVDASATEVAALPELEQNKLYLNNPLITGEQDTSFEPVEDELDPISEEDQALLGPPID